MIKISCKLYTKLMSGVVCPPQGPIGPAGTEGRQGEKGSKVRHARTHTHFHSNKSVGLELM